MGNHACCHPQAASVDLSTYLDANNDVKPSDDANTTQPNDKFFTNYVQTIQPKADPNEVQTQMDQRRIIFVSLTGLYTTWKNVPSVLLYTAFCFVPLKRKWIMQPSKYRSQLQKSLINPVTKMLHSGKPNNTTATGTNIQDVLQFIQLLQWKESQGLILWIFDYFDRFGNLIPNEKGSSVPNPLVASFWYAFNDKLIRLYDHITGSYYKSIHLEEEWWTNKDKYVSKYGVKPAVVLRELYFVTRSHSHNAIKEIIYQSNPHSLHPITVYKHISHENGLTTPVIIHAKHRLKAQSAIGIAISPLSPIKERPSAEVDPNDKKYDQVYGQYVARNVNQKDSDLKTTLNHADDHKDEE